MWHLCNLFYVVWEIEMFGWLQKRNDSKRAQQEEVHAYFFERSLREDLNKIMCLDGYPPELVVTEVLDFSSSDVIKKKIKSCQDSLFSKNESGQAKSYEEKLSLVEKLIMELCDLALKKRTLIGNNFVVEIAQVVNILTGESQTPQNELSTIRKLWPHTQPQPITFEVHSDWLGKTEANYPVDCENDQNLHSDWARLQEIYFNGKKQELTSSEAVEEQELTVEEQKLTSSETVEEQELTVKKLIKKMATFNKEVDNTIEKRLHCLQQNGGDFSPASQFFYLYGAWKAAVNTGGYLANGYQLKDSKTYKFRKTNNTLQCAIEIQPFFQYDTDALVIFAPVTFVAQFNLEPGKWAIEKVTFTCYYRAKQSKEALYGNVFDREWLEIFFSSFKPQEIRNSKGRDPKNEVLLKGRWDSIIMQRTVDFQNYQKLKKEEPRLATLPLERRIDVKSRFINVCFLVERCTNVAYAHMLNVANLKMVQSLLSVYQEIEFTSKDLPSWCQIVRETEQFSSLPVLHLVTALPEQKLEPGHLYMSMASSDNINFRYLSMEETVEEGSFSTKSLSKPLQAVMAQVTDDDDIIYGGACFTEDESKGELREEERITDETVQRDFNQDLEQILQFTKYGEACSLQSKAHDFKLYVRSHPNNSEYVQTCFRYHKGGIVGNMQWYVRTIQRSLDTINDCDLSTLARESRYIDKVSPPRFALSSKQQSQLSKFILCGYGFRIVAKLPSEEQFEEGVVYLVAGSSKEQKSVLFKFKYPFVNDFGEDYLFRETSDEKRFSIDQLSEPVQQALQSADVNGHSEMEAKDQAVIATRILDLTHHPVGPLALMIAHEVEKELRAKHRSIFSALLSRTEKIEGVSVSRLFPTEVEPVFEATQMQNDSDSKVVNSENYNEHAKKCWQIILSLINHIKQSQWYEVIKKFVDEQVEKIEKDANTKENLSERKQSTETDEEQTLAFFGDLVTKLQDETRTLSDLEIMRVEQSSHSERPGMR